MPAALIVQLLPQLLDVLVRYGPEAYNKIIAAIHNPAPTLSDWTMSLATPNTDKFLAETEGLANALKVADAARAQAAALTK